MPVELCPHCEGSPVVEVEVWGVYDGGLFFQCSNCHGAWHKWKDPVMRNVAQMYINQANHKKESWEKEKAGA